MLLDELAAWLHIIAHEHREYLVGIGCVLDGDTLQQARLGIHGGLPKLLGVHLTQTFISLCVDALAVFHALAILVEEQLALLLVVAILANALVALVELTLVERRRGDVKVSILDDLRHETIEERHDEGVDV